ncbi:MAG: radical SAM protein, partial [Myxococcota bacterium]|nr:radical SAM protein [Myxococcota bacterium]
MKRACPGAPVVVGGLTASRFAREILEASPAVDYVVRGEGELPMAALATALERGGRVAAVPNLVRRTAARIVANRRTFVADESFFAGLSFADTCFFAPAGMARQPYYFDPRSEPPSAYFAADVFYLAVGRGCTRNCAYCGGSARAHRRLSHRTCVSFRPPDTVIADLRKVADMGCRCAYVCFDPPPAAHAYYLELFRRLAKERLPIGLEFEAYLPHGPAFWEAMARAFDPCRSLVVFSPDSESEGSRRRIKGYGYTNVGLEADLGFLRGLGFRRGLYFSVCPGEDLAQARRTARWMESLRARFGAACWVHAIEIEPAAAWHEEPERWGLEETPHTFDDFLRRHRAGPAACSLDVGYRSAGFAKRFAILKAAERDPGEDVRRR